MKISGKAPSLRLQLSFWLLLPLMGLLALDAWLTYERAMSAAHVAFDRTLEASLRAMASGCATDGWRSTCRTWPWNSSMTRPARTSTT
jgi:two-component system sensor histidine kinase TctE